MKKLFLNLSLLAIFAVNAYPCFDTYLFLRKGSMVYPHKLSVLELNGEYSINNVKNPQNDAFFSNGNFYYGLTQNFSIQLGVGSGEKPRGEFKVDTYIMRGVYNLFSSSTNDYTLDVIIEHVGQFDESQNEIGLSLPNIFHFSDLTYVLHPTTSYTLQEKNLTVGGHLGVFYDFNQTGIVGVGAEYASVQSSSYAGRRITQSEVSTSLFFGAYIGKNIYFQNEIAKGLANSRDFGFALTTKVIL